MGSGSKDSPSRTRFLNCEVGSVNLEVGKRVERTIQSSKFQIPKPMGLIT
jgi:hypothetical protein